MDQADHLTSLIPSYPLHYIRLIHLMVGYKKGGSLASGVRSKFMQWRVAIFLQLSAVVLHSEIGDIDDSLFFASLSHLFLKPSFLFI
jgi:hypothetical protein